MKLPLGHHSRVPKTGLVMGDEKRKGSYKSPVLLRTLNSSHLVVRAFLCALTRAFVFTTKITGIGIQLYSIDSEI